MATRRGGRPGPEIPPPRGLTAHRFEVMGRDLVVLSYGASADLPLSLSRSEQEVAKALLAGASNAEIAAYRGVSARTVANQVASVYRKIGVSSRSELVAALAGRRAKARR